MQQNEYGGVCGQIHSRFQLCFIMSDQFSSMRRVERCRLPIPAGAARPPEFDSSSFLWRFLNVPSFPFARHSFAAVTNSVPTARASLPSYCDAATRRPTECATFACSTFAAKAKYGSENKTNELLVVWKEIRCVYFLTYIQHEMF